MPKRADLHKLSEDAIPAVEPSSPDQHNSFRAMPSLQRLRGWGSASWTFLRRTPPLVFAMAVLGLGLTTASGVLVKGIRNANDTITVTGASTERITSTTSTGRWK